jgi:hypothetical protein
MLWSNEYLARLAFDAETEIANETKCIIDRISISTALHVSEYQLPQYVFNVRKVYWKGFRLDPISGYTVPETAYDIITWKSAGFNPSAFSPAFLTGYSDITSTFGAGVKGGKPIEYFYAGFGENIIKINPSANEVLQRYEDGLWSNNIENSLIIEFYRFPDGENWKIPQYFRRRTIKAYVLWKAFAKEGDGQNLDASQYWEKRYHLLLGRAKIITDNIYKIYTYSRKPGNDIYCGNNFDYGYQGPTIPPRPILPSNYGITVEDCG